MKKKLQSIALGALLMATTSYAEAGASIEGVWELKDFKVEAPSGEKRDWCKGAHGVIMYVDGYMSTAVNCETDPSKVILYSGPYEFDGINVKHHPRNFSSPTLNRSFERQVHFSGKNILILKGTLDNNEVVSVTWQKRAVAALSQGTKLDIECTGGSGYAGQMHAVTYPEDPLYYTGYENGKLKTSVNGAGKVYFGDFYCPVPEGNWGCNYGREFHTTHYLEVFNSNRIILSEKVYPAGSRELKPGTHRIANHLCKLEFL